MTQEILKAVRAWRVFWMITARPRLWIALGLAVTVICASFLPSLHKDTRSDAFLPADDPSLLYRNKVRELFGPTDPMVIAVVNEGAQGVFNPHTLELVAWLTRQVESMDNVDPDRVTSLATENNISGDEASMLVEPFWQELPTTQAQADAVRAQVFDFPRYLGSIVTKDGTGTLIVAEVLDQEKAQPLYQRLLALAKNAPTMDGEQIHIAGEGAVSGYLGAYIDADAMRVNPLVAVVITIMLFIAFRSLRGALLPNLVVLGTAASALGLMAAFGVSFFVITNGLLPVLIGIAVADSIHNHRKTGGIVARRAAVTG